MYLVLVLVLVLDRTRRLVGLSSCESFHFVLLRAELRESTAYLTVHVLRMIASACLVPRSTDRTAFFPTSAFAINQSICHLPIAVTTFELPNGGKLPRLDRLKCPFRLCAVGMRLN